MSKKIYKVKETGEEVLLVLDLPTSDCIDCVLTKRCRLRPTNCIRYDFGRMLYFHFEKAF